ncbi:MAG TPA: hypothetical protein VH500_02775 [Nitrososphaeraceae archaeon]
MILYSETFFISKPVVSHTDDIIIDNSFCKVTPEQFNVGSKDLVSSQKVGQQNH